jgi:bacteriocin-like protein
MGKQKQRKPTKEPKTTEVATELTDEELSKVSGGFFNLNKFANIKDIEGESVNDVHRESQLL